MSNKIYPEVSSNPDFAAISKQILEYWRTENIFQKSIDTRPKKINGKDNEFIFFDGPPFANGLPHYGHLLTGFVKDIVARYQTQKGKRVERRFGWDCHGLPAEMGAEKDLGINGRFEIEKFGIEKFNNHCRESVMKYTSEWRKYVTNQARWVDFDNDYKTMETPYMESVIWAFKELYKKGLVYESMRVMPYSWACETPLSNFETRMDNSYRERADKAITVGFTLKNKPASAPDGFAKYKLLAWTTTPWTLPSNLALAIGDKLEYVGIRNDKNELLILAKSALGKYKKEFGEEPELVKISAKDLDGLEYEPLMPYFKGHPNSFKVFIADFVEDGEGTGIVHMAPGFGEDDQIVCQEKGIKLVCPVDNAGKFTHEVSDYEGLNIFDANDPIIIKLKEQDDWVKTEQYLHNYPHCWRTDTPLIYKAVPSWYVKVTEIKDKMVKNNQEINWIPGHIKDGLFGKWLENARDWSISRNRFWGTPIPVWISDDPRYPRIDVYGSIKEMEDDFGVEIKDIHRPFIDTLTRPNPDDPTGHSNMRRVSDVFDCWFESGSMPYAQAHYPFENKEKFEEHSSADFIVEYTAQTRGWFYTLMVLSTALFDKPPFLNCICHGVILDEEGQKLSKRLKNYADPIEIYEKYGSDALRFLMASSPVMRGQELLIDKDGQMVKDVVRLKLKPVWNAYNFFTLYANADGIKAEEISDSSNQMDQYILSKLAITLSEIDKGLEELDLPRACDAFFIFFETLNNWYIRRNRTRFWRSEKDEDKILAYNTLYTVLINLCKAGAPLMPLILEEIYLNLTGSKSDKDSVHLTSFPDYSMFKINKELVFEMDKIQDICTAALNIRNRENVRIRQPLAKVVVISKNLDSLSRFKHLIEDEVNVKDVVFDKNIEKFAELKLKLNFKELGKRVPDKIKNIIAASKKGEWKQDGGEVIIEGVKLDKNEFELTLDAFDKSNSASLPDNDALIMLDLNITEELKLEGIARDFVRAVQQARKDGGLDISDRIKIYVVNKGELLQQAIDKNIDYIKEQVLANEIEFSTSEADIHASVNVQDVECKFSLEKWNAKN
ncbi:MAG: isoleucine--tRNA ligase [Rickettsiales bacterium]